MRLKRELLFFTINIYVAAITGDEATCLLFVCEKEGTVFFGTVFLVVIVIDSGSVPVSLHADNGMSLGFNWLWISGFEFCHSACALPRE